MKNYCLGTKAPYEQFTTLKVKTTCQLVVLNLEKRLKKQKQISKKSKVTCFFYLFDHYYSSSQCSAQNFPAFYSFLFVLRSYAISVFIYFFNFGIFRCILSYSNHRFDHRFAWLSFWIFSLCAWFSFWIFIFFAWFSVWSFIFCLIQFDFIFAWFSVWSFSDSASESSPSLSASSLSCLDFSKHLHPYLKDDFHLNQCHCLSSLPQDFPHRRFIFPRCFIFLRCFISLRCFVSFRCFFTLHGFLSVSPGFLSPPGFLLDLYLQVSFLLQGFYLHLDFCRAFRFLLFFFLVSPHLAATKGIEANEATDPSSKNFDFFINLSSPFKAINSLKMLYKSINKYQK